MGTAAKDVYIWKRMTIPDTTGGGVYQPVEVTDVPVRGRLIRIRFFAASPLPPPIPPPRNMLEWYLADTPFDPDESVPTGGAMSIIAQQDTAVPTRNIDVFADRMKDATGADVAAFGIPFHLTETGPPGSGVGSLFLSFDLTEDPFDLDLILVIEPLVT